MVIILRPLRLGWGMLEYVLQVVIIAIIIMCIMLEKYKHAELKLLLNNEGDIVKENLSHIASAIIGLSDLLDEADNMIEQVSQVPSVGEMIQQMIGGFMMQKLQQIPPTISPLEKPPINEEVIRAETVPEHHGETRKRKDET